MRIYAFIHTYMRTYTQAAIRCFVFDLLSLALYFHSGMYVCAYVCMYVSGYACMYLCMYVRSGFELYGKIRPELDKKKVCMHVCMCMYAYVCIYVCMYV